MSRPASTSRSARSGKLYAIRLRNRRSWKRWSAKDIASSQLLKSCRVRVRFRSPKRATTDRWIRALREVSQYAGSGASVLTPYRSQLAAGLFACAVIVAFAVWVWTATRPTDPFTLAVLPFANLTGNPDREYLADGLTEEATATLAQIAPGQLNVVGRQSVMVYKRSSKSLVAIGDELGVNYLVESSIRAEGDRLRITSKLIRVRDQVQLWSQSYDRDVGSVLGLQQEVSTTIAEQIRLRLSPERIAAAARRQSESPEAFLLYLRGRYYASQRTPATVARALDYYQQATAIDPNYALAWSGIADALTSRPINSDFPPLEVRGPAREAAGKAVRESSTR